jgi:hypothetical protein
MTWRRIHRVYVPDEYRLGPARETGTTLNPALCLALCWGCGACRLLDDDR